MEMENKEESETKNIVESENQLESKKESTQSTQPTTILKVSPKDNKIGGYLKEEVRKQKADEMEKQKADEMEMLNSLIPLPEVLDLSCYWTVEGIVALTIAPFTQGLFHGLGEGLARIIIGSWWLGFTPYVALGGKDREGHGVSRSTVNAQVGK